MYVLCFAKLGYFLHYSILTFTTASVLMHFQLELPLTIEAYASAFALGCILSQTSPTGDLHPMCVYSPKFTPAELNYPIYDKELLDVVEDFKQ